MKKLTTHSAENDNFPVSAGQLVDWLDQAALDFIWEMIPEQQFLLVALPDLKLSRAILSNEEVSIFGELYDIGRTTMATKLELRVGKELICKCTLRHIQVDDQWKKQSIDLDIHETNPEQSRVVRLRRRARWSAGENNERHANHIAP